MTERHERSFAPSLQLFSLSDLADGLDISHRLEGYQNDICWPKRQFRVLGRLLKVIPGFHSDFACLGVLIILRITGRSNTDWKLAPGFDVCDLL